MTDIRPARGSGHEALGLLQSAACGPCGTRTRSAAGTSAGGESPPRAGFEGRGTDGTVCVCLEGTADASVEGVRFELSPNDVVVVPSWRREERT